MFAQLLAEQPPQFAALRAGVAAVQEGRVRAITAHQPKRRRRNISLADLFAADRRIQASTPASAPHAKRAENPRRVRFHVEIRVRTHAVALWSAPGGAAKARRCTRGRRKW
ncbi:MAG: hypothetical protein R3C16_02530 [Hyphomonadaceae bacterium]